jgi:DICT domain-containing protein
VLILPADFQVDPAELGKYARYSADPVRFRNWYAKRETFAAMMNSIEDYLLRRLRAGGVVAVSFREAAVARGIPAQRLFDRDSHHLTAEGHALASELLTGAAQ